MLGAVILGSTLASGAAQGAWRTITMYDVLVDDCRNDVKNMNLGDIPGDAYFMLKDKYLKYACPKYCADPSKCKYDAALFDCSNAESKAANRVVRKIEVEVMGEFGSYQLCNVGSDSCDYTCTNGGGQGQVGNEAVKGGFQGAPTPNSWWNTKDVDYWNYNIANTLIGNWYSLTSDGYGKYWRNATIVKTINAECSNAASTAVVNVIVQKGSECFSKCESPTDESTECYMKCFFDTALGEGSDKSTTLNGGLGRDALSVAWAKGFESDDISQGGCPPCPATGSCPESTMAMV